MANDIDIAACVEALYPNPGFKGSATILDFKDWGDREWIDGRGEKPTQEEIEAVWPDVQKAIAPLTPEDELARTLAEYTDATVAAATVKAVDLRAAITARNGTLKG